MGFFPEDNRRRFWTVWLGCTGHPFMFAQQLEDATTRWLQPGESAGEERMLEQVTEGHFTVHHNVQPLEGQPPAPSRPIPEARKRSLALLVDPGPHDTPFDPEPGATRGFGGGILCGY